MFDCKRLIINTYNTIFLKKRCSCAETPLNKDKKSVSAAGLPEVCFGANR
jgi:hypothetical protein